MDNKKKFNNKKTNSNQKAQLTDKNKVRYNVFLNSKPQEKIELPKFKKRTKTPKEILMLVITYLQKNIHIIFNSLLLFTFLVFILGLFTTKLFSAKINIYIVTIAIFFMLIAISYNKYLSGKVFTIILSLIMGLGIYYMNDTYGYLNSFNDSYYEIKNYYIVAFDNNTNKNLYNINNKTVGILKTNSSNIKKIINTKIAGVRYIEYTNINELYRDFFNEKTRAIIINENEYMYLENDIEHNSRNVKILDKFDTCSPKR